MAEVLIVIGIIGVVAEMTIPTLMQNIEVTSNRIMFKKIFGQLNGVFTTMINDNGGSFVGLSSDYDILRQYFSRYFKKLDECTWGNSRNKCWHDYSQIRDYSGNIVVDNSNPYADIYRADVQVL